MKKYIVILLMSFVVANSYAQTPQKITYVYDDLSRLSSVTYPNGSQIVYTYDALGNRMTQVISTSVCTPPSAPTVSSTTINSGQTATLTATNCTGTVNWFSAASGGASLFTGASFTSPALNTTTTYYASCTVNNCESITRGSGLVTVNCTPPSAPTVYSTTINSGQIATLTASNCTGTVNWFSVSTGGASLFTGASFTSPALTLSTTYYASCTVSGCESAIRGSGLVTVNAVCTSMFSLKTGNWNDVTVWSCGRVPTSTDIITVKANHFITIPAAYTANAKNVVFEMGGKIIEAASTSKLCLSCPDIPINGLVAYYPFSGNANDASGNAVNGTNNGGTFVNDRLGNVSKAIQLNGSSWVDIGTTLQNNLFTINLWVYVPSLPATGTNYALISKLDNNNPNLFKNYEIYLLPNGKVNVIIAGGFSWNNFTSINTLQTNQWKMLTLSYNGSLASLYINGVLDASYSTNYVISNVKTVFGRRAGPNNSADNIYLNGSLDDIRFYNRALTSTEISTIYNIEK